MYLRTTLPPSLRPRVSSDLQEKDPFPSTVTLRVLSVLPGGSLVCGVPSVFPLGFLLPPHYDCTSRPIELSVESRVRCIPLIRVLVLSRVT